MVSLTIKKPLFDNFVYIRESLLNKAILRNERIEVIIPAGSALIDPKIWKQTGKRMEKVFLRPDEPMVLFGNYLLKNENQNKLF